MLAVLLLVACQPLPQPFREANKTENALLAPGIRAGVVVAPIADAPAPLSRAVSEAVAAALQESDIPAAARAQTAGAGNRGSFALLGRAVIDSESAVGSETGSEILVAWRLMGPQGDVVGTFAQREAATGTAISGASAELVGRLAEYAAVRVVGLIANIDPGGTPGPVSESTGLPRLVLWSVDGAPGDGRTSLTAAMAEALRRAGVPLTLELEDDSLLLLGSVHLAAAENRLQRIEITWTVLKPDGESLGTVSQSNTLPAGALDGPWGPIAVVVAENGAGGVVGLLRRVVPATEGSR